MITIRPMQLTSPDFVHLKRINWEAFPENERIPPEGLFEAPNLRADVFGIYEEDIFVGFIALRIKGSCAYICFFAMDEAFRNRGIGGQALQLLPAQYPGCQIVVDFESIDVPCDNLTQRAHRRAFYFRNGYQPTGLYLYYMETEFEVAYMGSGPFDEPAFLGVIQSLHDAFPDFDPEIRHKTENITVY